LTSGEHTTVTVTISNTGNAAWDLDATRLGTAAPQDRESAFFLDGDWVSTARATGVDARVEPGATGTFTFEVVAPEVRESTMFDEGFQLVQDDATWFGPEVHVIFNVQPNGIMPSVALISNDPNSNPADYQGGNILPLTNGTVSFGALLVTTGTWNFYASTSTGGNFLVRYGSVSIVRARRSLCRAARPRRTAGCSRSGTAI
jgi:hypothetical protein